MFGGSITGLPIIETINSDITEYIATNVISITDGQFYTNKRLFLDSYRPAIDSGLSVSRIGSNAQCKLIKVYSVGIKNLMNQQKSLFYNIIFFQDHLFISTFETSLFLLFLFRNSIKYSSLVTSNQFNSLFLIHRFLFMLSIFHIYIYYILLISKSFYSFLIINLFFICLFFIVLTHVLIIIEDRMH